MRCGVEFDSKRFIRETKSELLRRFDVTKAFAKSRDMMLREVEAIRARYDSELPVIPQVDYHKIAECSVEEPFRELVRRRGCVIVKGVFDSTQVGEGRYLNDRNVVLAICQYLDDIGVKTKCDILDWKRSFSW